jgi:hypothetical protein
MREIQKARTIEALDVMGGMLVSSLSGRVWSGWWCYGDLSKYR